MTRMIALACSEAKLKKSEAMNVLEQYREHESQDSNLFGVVNAITRAGQTLSNEAWVKFDEIGGSYVGFTSGQFASMKTKANALTGEDMVKIFGSAVQPKRGVMVLGNRAPLYYWGDY